MATPRYKFHIGTIIRGGEEKMFALGGYDDSQHGGGVGGGDPEFKGGGQLGRDKNRVWSSQLIICPISRDQSNILRSRAFK